MCWKAIVQQADESSAFDVAWNGDGPPIVAWDEDAPIAVGEFVPDRGRVRVQILGAPTKDPDGGTLKPNVPSPYSTDADTPRLLPRSKGGYFLAWLARRPESTEDAGIAPEAPGEHRVFRFVEIVELSASGEVAGPIRRVSSEKGHVVAFDLLPGSGGSEVVVVAQDEAAYAEHSGARIVRYALSGTSWDPTDIVDAGVGHALSEIVAIPSDAGASRWLSWMDGAEHAHLLPLGPSIAPSAPATLESPMDGARLLAAGPGDAVYVLGGSTVRRFVCR